MIFFLRRRVKFIPCTSKRWKLDYLVKAAENRLLLKIRIFYHILFFESRNGHFVKQGVLAWAAGTNYNRLGGLNKRN